MRSYVSRLLWQLYSWSARHTPPTPAGIEIVIPSKTIAAEGIIKESNICAIKTTGGVVGR